MKEVVVEDGTEAAALCGSCLQEWTTCFGPAKKTNETGVNDSEYLWNPFTVSKMTAKFHQACQGGQAIRKSTREVPGVRVPAVSGGPEQRRAPGIKQSQKHDVVF